MPFPSIEAAITACTTHLDTTRTRGTEIEDFLTRFLLIHICGTYEIEIRRLVVERAKRTNDNHVTAFVENMMRDYRSLKVTDLKGKLLKKFSEELSATFDRTVGQDDVALTQYGNIVQNRHEAAHGKEINMTFDELVESFHQSEKIIAAIEKALS
jgi:hypothetical protein